MKLNSMLNLFVGIENVSDRPFKVAIVADNVEETQKIVAEYAADGGFNHSFKVSEEFLLNENFDCDYVLTK